MGGLGLAGVALIVAGALGKFSDAAPLPSKQFSDVTATAQPASAVAVKPLPADGQTTGVAVIDPASMGPNRILIPSLGIYAEIIPVPVDNGALVIPDQPRQVGLDESGPPPVAQQGSTLIAGHVNMAGTQGALANLAGIQPGARIVVTDASRVRTDWAVDGLTVVRKAALPTGLDRGDGPRRLVVVTCGGQVHNGQYDMNVIAYAHPVNG